MLEKYQINIYVLCITIAPHASSWKKKTLINKCKYHIVYTVQVYKLSEYRKYTRIYSNILFSMRNTATYIYFKLAVKLYQNINDCLYDTDNQNQDPPPLEYWNLTDTEEETMVQREGCRRWWLGTLDTHNLVNDM